MDISVRAKFDPHIVSVDPVEVSLAFLIVIIVSSVRLLNIRSIIACRMSHSS